jgi:transposase
MSQSIVYVGIDVDDERYHGCALNRHTGEVLDFRCRPTLKGLADQLRKMRDHFGAVQMKLCYEASYVGFSLQRGLNDRGYDCAVVAPSSIPRRLGKSAKTDGIDAAELAEFYANDLLTVVSAPDAQLEQDRDLLRSRQQLMQQQLNKLGELFGNACAFPDYQEAVRERIKESYKVSWDRDWGALLGKDSSSSAPQGGPGRAGKGPRYR